LFSSAGQYGQLDGTATGEVVPEEPLNPITDCLLTFGLVRKLPSFGNSIPKGTGNIGLGSK